jgi:hypothetical protein
MKRSEAASLRPGLNRRPALIGVSRRSISLLRRLDPKFLANSAIATPR